MKINRAGPNTRAFWRSQCKWRQKWLPEKPIMRLDKAYGQHAITTQRLQGHAAGWIDGVAWARRFAREKRERG